MYVICGEIEAMTAFLRQFMNSKNMCNHKRTISTSSDKKAVNFYILAILMTGEKYFFLLQWSLQFTQPVNLIRSATPLTPLHTPFPFFLFNKNLRFIATEVQAKQKSPFLLKTYKYGADFTDFMRDKWPQQKCCTPFSPLKHWKVNRGCASAVGKVANSK